MFTQKDEHKKESEKIPKTRSSVVNRKRETKAKLRTFVAFACFKSAYLE